KCAVGTNVCRLGTILVAAMTGQVKASRILAGYHKFVFTAMEARYFFIRAFILMQPWRSSRFCSQYNMFMVKEYQEKDKIRSKLDKNGKRGEAGKSQKQLQWKKKVKLKKTQKERPNLLSLPKFY
nr:hypothetical protein [Tanacetum cinerariifolium]